MRTIFAHRFNNVIVALVTIADKDLVIFWVDAKLNMGWNLLAWVDTPTRAQFVGMAMYIEATLGFDNSQVDDDHTEAELASLLQTHMLVGLAAGLDAS